MLYRPLPVRYPYILRYQKLPGKNDDPCVISITIEVLIIDSDVDEKAHYQMFNEIGPFGKYQMDFETAISACQKCGELVTETEVCGRGSEWYCSDCFISTESEANCG